jgi:hypothetical protein
MPANKIDILIGALENIQARGCSDPRSGGNTLADVEIAFDSKGRVIPPDRCSSVSSVPEGLCPACLAKDALKRFKKAK